MGTAAIHAGAHLSMPDSSGPARFLAPVSASRIRDLVTCGGAGMPQQRWRLLNHYRWEANVVRETEVCSGGIYEGRAVAPAYRMEPVAPDPLPAATRQEVLWF